MNREDQRKTMLLFGIKLIQYLGSIALFYWFWIIFRYGIYTKIGYGFRYNYYVTIGYAVVLLMLNRTYNAYLLGYTRIRSLAFSQFLAQFFSVAIMWFLVLVAWRKYKSPVIFLGLLAVQGVLDIIWSYSATWLYFRLYKPRRTILIYRNSLDKHRFGSISGKPTERLYKIVKEIKYDGNFKGIREQLVGYDAVFVAGVNSRCRNGILKFCKEQNIPGFFLPHVGDVIMQGAKHIQSFDSPVLYVNRKTLEPEYVVAKRSFDILMSAIGIVILSPVLLITAIAIKLYDHGPAL